MSNVNASGPIVGGLAPSVTGVPYLSASHPDVPPASPSQWDDEFNGTSLASKWTQNGAASISFSDSHAIFPYINAGDSGATQAFVPGAGAFTLTAKFTGITFWGATDYVGILVLDGSLTGIASFDLRYDGVFKLNRDNPGGIGTQQFATIPSEFYIRIHRDASNNYTGSVSWDGRAWITPIAAAASATTVGNIRFRFGQTASQPKVGSIDWIRVTLS